MGKITYKRFVILIMVFSLICSILPMNVSAHGDVTNHTEEVVKEKPKKVKFEESFQNNVEKVEEVKEKRKENEKTFVNSDMSYTTEVYTGPVHFEDSKKKWQTIDNRLETNSESDKGDFQYKNKKNRFSIKLSPNTKKKELVSLKIGNEKLGFTIENANNVKVVKKDGKAIYKEIFEDTDVEYTLLANGIKEDIILHTKEAATTFDYAISGTLTAKKVDKHIDFFNENGDVIWTMLPPNMEDANGEYSEDIEYSVINKGKKQYVRVDIDKDYITDPKRKFPIIVDPTVSIGGTASNTIDTYVMKEFPDTNYYNSTDLRTGYTDSTGTTRSYLKFSNSLPSLNGGLLVSAQLKLYKFSEGLNDSINTNVYAQRVTSAWDSSTLTYNKQPTYDTSKSYGSTAINGSNGWYTLNLSDLVDQWYGGTANNGIVLRSTSEGTLGTYRKFYASDNGSNQPYLSVTYSGIPAAPTGTAVGNGINKGTGYANLSWNAVTGATGYKVLMYNGASYQEIDVGNVTSWSTKGKKLWPTAAQIASGEYKLRLDGTGTELSDDPRPVYKNSKGIYPERKNYWFRIKAYNKYGTTSQSAEFKPTITDQTAPTKPGKPTVSNPLNSKFMFTWPASTDSNSGIAKYMVYMGTSSGATDVLNGREVTGNTFTYPQAGDPPLNPRVNYYFYVKAVDKEGNYSANSDIGSGVARLARDASIQSSSIPNSMEGGNDYEMQITVKNEGIETWEYSSTNKFGIGAVNDPDPFTKDTRLYLSSTESIATGKTKTFTVKVNGGKKLGTLNTSWRMLKIDNGFFGDTLSKDVKVVDTTPPKGGISINGGEEYTNSQNVTLTLNAGDNVSDTTSIQQKLKNEDASYTAYEKFTATKPWTLSNENGTKNVTVVYKDASNNESTPATASIKYDASIPTAKITSPDNLNYLNGNIEIKGDVNDADLKNFTVEYAKGESPTNDDWITINTGNTNKSNDVLAKWDTTNIPTGKYTIRLTATDLAGNSAYSQKYIWIDQQNGRLGTEAFWGMESVTSSFGTSGINLSNGNLLLDYEDATLDGRQLDPSIGRTYNSLDQRSGLLGKGWRLSVESSLKENSNSGDIQYTDEDGTIHTFTKNADGTYTAPKGVYQKLTKNSTDATYSLLDLSPSSVTTSFDSEGKVTSISDKNNNKISMKYQSGKLSEIVDDVGRSITFTYNEEDLIEEIKLYNGNSIHYQYKDKLLTNVQFINSSGEAYRELTYIYNDRGQLVESIDPNKNHFTYQYSGIRLINVTSPHTAREASSGKLLDAVMLNESFTYDLEQNRVFFSTSGPSSSQETEYTLNENGNLIETILDPKGIKVQNKFTYQDNKLIENIDSKGYKTSYEYDSIGNLLKETEQTVTDIDGEKTTPVTKYEYKSGTSLVSKETDPLGRVLSYEYDTKGNRTQMTDVDGFKVNYEYDQYGNLQKETSERGALYGALLNFSFEEGEAISSLKNWKISGAPVLENTIKKSGVRSLKLTGTSSAESDYVSIKKGKLPVRGLVWVKTDSGVGTGAVGTLTFYDSNKTKISEKNSSAVTGTNDWKLLHVSESVPSNAAYVTFKVSSSLTSGAVYVDDVWLEEANVTSQYKYSDDGLYLLSEMDPYGKETKYEYDQAGNKISETNAINQQASYVYDPDRKLTESIDRKGKKTKYEYDTIGNLVKETNPLNQIVEYKYDETNSLTMTTNPKVTTQEYDGQIALTPKVEAISLINQYNEFGQKVAETDGNKNITYSSYDSIGRLISTKDPLKNEARYEYDINGNKVKEEDWAYDITTNSLYKKGTTYFNYDELNREISYTDASGDKNAIVEKTKYNEVDNEIKNISGTGTITEYKYNKNNESIYSKESSTPAVETWALYDGEGNLAISLDKQGASYNVTDTNGNLLEVVDSEGKKTSYTYNAVGDKLTQVDSTGTETEWKYDEEGQIIKESVKIVDPQNNSTKYQITEYTYDSIGQVSKKVMKEQSGDTTTTSKEIDIQYDELGQVMKESGLADGKKTDTRYAYDQNGNVIKTWVYDETVSVPIEFDNDKDGFFNSETVTTYDPNNRVISEEVSHTGTKTITQNKDHENTEVISTNLGDTTIQYDDNDRTKKIVTPNFDTYSYDYLVDDSLSKVTAPGLTSTFTYNGGSKVSTIKGVNKEGKTVIDYGYSYTDTEQISQVNLNGQAQKKYTYTANGYLETVEANGKKLKYTQDGNGNITKVENLTTGKTIETYLYATGNRIKQKKEYDEQTGSLIRTTDYVFGTNGAVAKKTITEGTKVTIIDYVYNSDDQLIIIRNTVDGEVEKELIYEYDQEGNRLSKTIDHSHYHYHRDANGEIFMLTMETGAEPIKVAKFHKDSDGNLLSFSYNDVTYYYQFNARGDVIALTDASGNIVVSYDYDEWGNLVSMTGDKVIGEANPYRYVGKYGVFYDSDSSMYLMGWRDYDPTTGRFIVADEYEGEEDEPTSLNRYLYAEGDPVNNIDPDGHAPKWLQKGWKATKKAAKKGYNFAVGDDIRTIKSKKSKWYQKAGATASIASNFIPGAGQAKLAAKAGIKSVKYGKKVKKSKKFVASSVKKTRKSKLKVKTKSKAKSYKVRGKKAKVSSNKSNSKSRTTKSTKSCKNCFTLDTKVHTKDGEKSIQDVKLGDRVLAKDDETGKTAYKEVINLFQRTVTEIYEIHIGKDIIETTKEHPFWVVGEGWVEVDDLKAGDHLETDDGKTVVVDDIVVKKKETTVYNFEVAEYHSYFVSNLGVWTHNQCKVKPKYVPKGTGNRPPNLTPAGAGRNGAFREAKRNSGIPVSQQPKKVTPAVDRRGNKIPGRDYDFGDGKIIRDHSGGHKFPDEPRQNRGPHFNDVDGEHYDY